MEIRLISDLIPGDKVFLKEAPDVFTVQAKKENFIVATNVVELGHYIIIDTEKNLCGPHDRVFRVFDFKTKEGILELLEHLVQKKDGIKLSRRYSRSISMMIDIPKTLNLDDEDTEEE